MEDDSEFRSVPGRSPTEFGLLTAGERWADGRLMASAPLRPCSKFELLGLTPNCAGRIDSVRSSGATDNLRIRPSSG